jgi:hypothetical protein
MPKSSVEDIMAPYVRETPNRIPIKDRILQYVNNPDSYQRPPPMFKTSIGKMTTSPTIKEIDVKTPPKKRVTAKKQNPGSAIRSR